MLFCMELHAENAEQNPDEEEQKNVELDPAKIQATTLHLLGRWRFTSVLDSTPIVSLSDKEAKSFIGTYLTISQKRVQFHGKICMSPSYAIFYEDRDESFRKGFHMNPQYLSLPTTVTTIEAKCMPLPRQDAKKNVVVTYLYIRDKNRVVLYWGGFFFNAVKVNTQNKSNTAHPT